MAYIKCKLEYFKNEKYNNKYHTQHEHIQRDMRFDRQAPKHIANT